MWRLCAFLLGLAGSATAAEITAPCTDARFAEPTTRYAHCVLGDCAEWGSLIVTNAAGQDISFDLPADRVFEDLAPRCASIDGKGTPAIIVIESQADSGAQLAAYGLNPDGTAVQKIAATPHIGQSNRWLAPIGIADFNGDGQKDMAYIDRPHLAKTLRVVTLDGDRLVEIANARGFTNHRIGEDFISGGVRDCGQGPEMVTVDASWRNVMITRMRAGRIEAAIHSPYEGQDTLIAALDCL